MTSRSQNLSAGFSFVGRAKKPVKNVVRLHEELASIPVRAFAKMRGQNPQ
jgi:hypothetical protein